MGIGAVQAHGYATAHLVGPADERQPETGVQVAVVELLGVQVPAQGLDGVGPARGGQHGLFAVGQREVRDYDGASLGVGAVGPVGQRRLERAAELALARPVGAPWHHGLLQAPQDEVTQDVLAVFLADIGGITAVRRRAHPSGEVLCIGKQRSPLGLQEVDHPQVLALLLQVRSLVERKWTWESPEYHPEAAMSVQREICSVSSRWPGSIRTRWCRGVYSNPLATSTRTSPRGSHPWQVPSM